MPRTIFSAAEEYLGAAAAELGAAFPDAAIERLGPDLGVVEATGLDLADIAAACHRGHAVFVRHLFREVARLPFADDADEPERILLAALDILGGADPPPAVALQVWASDAAPTAYRLEGVWWRLADAFGERGVAAARAGRPEVLSVCVTPSGVLLGCNPSPLALVDWGGGRVRLARDADRVSRSEFKLEELFRVYDPPLPAGGVALDLGASPGGWTRVLRRRGLAVWAVDPGALDPRLSADPGVRHVRTTAARFLAAPGRDFDLVVNDMRMAPALSCRIMEEAAPRLGPGGIAIVTLKLAQRDALPTVRAGLAALGRAYEVVFARQLYHNRHEVTVVARRRAISSASRSVLEEGDTGGAPAERPLGSGRASVSRGLARSPLPPPPRGSGRRGRRPPTGRFRA